MTISNLARYAAGVAAASTILAACSGGAQPQFEPAGPVQQGSQVAPAVRTQSRVAQPFNALKPDSVVYTTANEGTTGSGKFELDLNSDGVADFTFEEYYSPLYSGAGEGIGPPRQCGAIGGLSVTARRHDGVENGAQIGEAVALLSGSPIDSQSSFSPKESSMFGYATGCVPPHHRPGTYGYWGGARSTARSGAMYLALELKIGGHTHYGWAQMSVGEGYATLTGYAYETVAGKSIMAGQM